MDKNENIRFTHHEHLFSLNGTTHRIILKSITISCMQMWQIGNHLAIDVCNVCDGGNLHARKIKNKTGHECKSV